MVEIYGTLGPSCNKEETLRKMFEEGMTGVRLNLSHSFIYENINLIESVKKAALHAGTEPKLLIDLQGPELRIGALGKELLLSEGDEFILGENGVPLEKIILSKLEKDMIILLDDGKIQAHIMSNDGRTAKAIVDRGGLLRSRKSILIKDYEIEKDALTESDIENIRCAVDIGITGIMQPFVRGKEDILSLKNTLQKEGGSSIEIYAKIENTRGINKLDEIMEESDEIIIARGDLGNAVPLWELPGVQKNIAEKLVFLQDSPNLHKVSNIKKELKKVEKNSDIELSSMQKEAIEKINENNVCIITGGPGTGKTTIIKAIIDIYESYNKKVVLCAPTGRAAKRMTETTGKEAKTLHRMLEIGKIEDENKIDTIDKNVEPLSADIVIVDEMSMVDIFLMNYLVKALFQGTKLVLVGDVDQLPSVGPGSILKDIINSETITTITLKEIFRQAAKSKIILNSHRVNQGESFLSKEEIEEELDEDFFYINETNQEKILNQVVSLCNGRLQNYGDYDFFKNIQVITPTKKGMLGTKELNKTLQKFLNPESEYLKEKQFGDVVYREKDRVMQIKNNYDIIWEKDNNEHEIGAGVFNGELGTIEKIDEEERQIQIRFDDDKVAIYQFQDLDQIEHSYSITIHKAQGSEFDVVIMVVPQSAPVLLTRNLLYTGMTRAKKMLIVIGNNNIIDFMIQNVDVKKRNTGLEEKLKNLS